MAEEVTQKRVSDYDLGGDGEYTKVADLVDQEIVVDSIEETETEFGATLIVRYRDGFTDEGGYFFSSHRVMAKKLRKLWELGAFPVGARIVKPTGKPYYDLV